jgi:hypothetical protein
MKKLLEFIRAAIVISAGPVVLLFYASSSHAWLILGLYVVLATVALPILNSFLKEEVNDDSKGVGQQPPD